MFKTLDILIGATTVLLVFSMAVTVITQTLSAAFGRRGKHLMQGISDLLLQLGIDTRSDADQIATAVLKHPLIAGVNGRLGTVIQREELTKLLLDLASGTGPSDLGADAKAALNKMLTANGVPDPGATLKQIRAAALQVEDSQPELANDVRQAIAILRTSKTDYVARLNAWFDQTMDRVSERFTRYTHLITITLATIVVLTVQLDTIAVIDRLSIDDQFRAAFVDSAVKDYGTAEGVSQPSTAIATTVPEVSPKPYYDLLGKAGLITLPSGGWLNQMADARKYPGLLLSILLLSLGAPFWYNVLKDLVGLRSTLSKKDDAQRVIRQTTQGAAAGTDGQKK
jgi:hypothetical protein